MKHLTGLCASALPRNVHVPTPARLPRLVHGTRRGIANGGHYVVPKPFNEPNVSKHQSWDYNRSLKMRPVRLCEGVAGATET